MGKIVGKNVKINMAGSSVAVTNEPTSRIGTTNDYQITLESRQVIDASQTISVEVGGSQVTSGFTIDYLFGVISFSSSQTGEITISYSYLPLATIAGATSGALRFSRTLNDITAIQQAPQDQGYGRFRGGKRSITVTLERIFNYENDFIEAMQNNTALLIGFEIGRRTFRGFYKAENSNRSGDLDTLENESLSFQIDSNNADDIKKRYSSRSV